MRYLHQCVHQPKKNFLPHGITSNYTLLKYYMPPYGPPKRNTLPLSLGLAKLRVQLMPPSVLNGRCWLYTGLGGKPFGHAEIRLPNLIAKLDGEAVSEPHVAEAVEVEGVCAPLLSELGDEVHQKGVCHTQGTPQRVVDGKVNGIQQQNYMIEREKALVQRQG